MGRRRRVGGRLEAGERRERRRGKRRGVVGVGEGTFSLISPLSDWMDQSLSLILSDRHQEASLFSFSLYILKTNLKLASSSSKKAFLA